MNKYTINNCSNCKFSMFIDGDNRIYCELTHKFKKAFIDYCKRYRKKEGN